MIIVPGIGKKKIGVYGLGATGLATCEALAASGAEVYCWDDKEEARNNGIEALQAGVGKVHMIDGRISHSLLLEIFTESGIGTELVKP